ncbi:MAG TPA: hypothetical protein DD438_00645 [Verrucomicrobiales bacterium]|nr:hypothetical protein [Roseibacillus sp.]HBM76588.1 hypothetical protein [Verrucomicrobiales bacterium]HCQ37604.1 hypothetical protein [Verrucomicrobiales bacterium]
MRDIKLLPGRRAFLRGLGATLALPGFSSLGLAKPLAGARGLTASGAPLRMAYLCLPNGVIMDKWRPQGVGEKFVLNDSMQSLKDASPDIQIVKGLEQANGWGGRDGAGDHARGNATFLTGTRPRKTSGSDIRLGISVDQMAANYLAQETRLPSLELSCDGVRKSGSCDSGYSCAYQYNISWRSSTQPMTPESNPRLVFERLFGSGSQSERGESQARRRAEKRSILDFVLEDAKAMEKSLGRNDQQKLDEYMTGVREIERQIEKAESIGPPPDPGVEPPANGAPREYHEHIRIMFEMMILAFQTDQTRIASFLLAHDGSNRNFPTHGVREGHHGLSHHGGNRSKIEKIAKIDTFYLEQLAYFLERMRNTKDVDGKPLLYNSMIVWGGGLSDGDRHTHNDLPIILAGNAGGKFRTGRHVDLKGDVPMNNLYLRMLDEIGAPAGRLGDSTGILSQV